MKSWALFFFLKMCLLSSLSHATVTLVSITGDSAQDLSEATSPKIYAGFTGCTTGDGTNVCDTCTGEIKTGSKLWTCNKKSTYPNLKLIVRVQTATAGVTVADSIVTIGGKDYTPTTVSSVADGILTVQLTWSEICNHSEVGRGSNCDGGNFTTDLGVGFKTTTNGSTTTDTLTFKIYARVASVDSSDWFHTDCGTMAGTANAGACHFTAFPGDEKVYANDLAVVEGYPATGATGINYTNAVFFYEQKLASDVDDDATIARINNKTSPLFELGVNTAASPPFADNRITGLSNGTRYCFVMANKDATGTISYFTPITGSGAVLSSTLCTEPSKVVGLLDDKSCFIATAAFGSDMAPEVQSFRDFRNKYLLPYSWGRSFVKFYYKHSPFYANLIAENEVTKSIVRGALWPLLFFARMTVNMGFWFSFVLLSLSVASLYILFRNRVFKRRFRGEM